MTVRYLDFKTRSHQKKLSEPTDISLEITECGKQLLRKLWDGKTPLRLIGIALSDVTKEGITQLSLFPEDNLKREKHQKMDRTMDDILDRFGRGSIKRGSGLDPRGGKR